MTDEVKAIPVKNVHQKMLSVMSKVNYVKHDEKSNGLRYTFASHNEVTSAIRPALIEEGIMFSPVVESYGPEGHAFFMKLRADFINADNPEDRITYNIHIPSFAQGGQYNEKTFGSTYSYACKYALLKALMLETGDEEIDKIIPEKQVNKNIADRPISEDQAAVLKEKIGDDLELLNRILTKNAINGLEQIKLRNFAEIISGIDRYKKLKEKEVKETEA